MKIRIALMLLLLILVLSVFSAIGANTPRINLNQPAPFPENI